MPAVLPGLTVQFFEKHPACRMPAPPEIFSNFRQTFQAFREIWEYCFYGIHSFESFFIRLLAYS
jgi:hypothetical protein